MARIQDYMTGEVPSTEQRVDYQPTSTAQGVAAAGAGLEDLGHVVRKRAIDVAKANADLEITNNAVAQEISISSMKKSVDLTNPDAFAEVMKPFDDANKTLLDNANSEEVRSHITNTVADHRARYVQMLISKNAKLQNQDFLASKDKTVNALAESTQTNPGLLADNLQTSNKLFDGMLEMGISEGVVERAREATKMKLNQSAADGKILSNPVEAHKAISEGQFELGDKQDFYLKKASSAIEANAARNRAAGKRVDAAVKKQQTDNYVQDSLAISKGDPAAFDNLQKASVDLGTPTSRYSYTQYQQLLNQSKRASVADGKDNKVMAVKAEKYLRDNPGDTAGMLSQYSHYLSSSTAQRLVDQYTTPDGVKADRRTEWKEVQDFASKSLVHNSISPFGDKQGIEDYSNTMNKINEEYKRESATGVSDAELFDKSGKGKSLYRLITPATRGQVKQKQLNAMREANKPDPTVSPATGGDNPVTPETKHTPAQLSPTQQAAMNKMIEGLKSIKPEGRK